MSSWRLTTTPKIIMNSSNPSIQITEQGHLSPNHYPKREYHVHSDKLPLELVKRILLFCDINTLLQCRLVNHLFCWLASGILYNSPPISTGRQLKRLCKLLESSSSTPSSPINEHFRHLNFSKRPMLYRFEDLAVLLGGCCLSSLNLANCRRLSSSELHALLKMVRRVQHLNLDYCSDSVSDETIMILADTHAGHLKSISLLECRRLTNQMFVSLSAKCHIHSMRISFAKQITGRGFRTLYLNEHTSSALRELHVRGCGRWEDLDMQVISFECRRLQSVKLISNSGKISGETILEILLNLNGSLKQLTIVPPLMQSIDGNAVNRDIICCSEQLEMIKAKYPKVSLNVGLPK